MNQHNTWMLVADASRARLFQVDDERRRQQTQGTQWLTLLSEFDHPESRQPAHELVSDRQGRVKQSAAPARGDASSGAAKGNRSGMEPHTSPRAVEHERFARELAGVLRKGLLDHQFEHLVLVVAPGFLGELRQVLDEQVTRHVVATENKDLTHMDVEQLAARLSAITEQEDRADQER